MTWRKWIGLPHEFGADPEQGKAADCLLMVWRILDDAGIDHPEFNAYWLDIARQGDWPALEALWRDGTTELDQPKEYAVTLFHNGPNGLGVGRNTNVQWMGTTSNNTSLIDQPLFGDRL